MSECRLGIGVMLGMMSRQEHETDPAQELYGKTIASVVVDDDANGGDGALVFTFTDDWGLRVFDNGRSCCEARYMNCDDDLSAYVDAKLQKITVECGGTTEDKWGVCCEVQFLLVHTDRGIFTVNTHNDHNGYYGGFYMVADVMRPENAS